MATSVPKSRSPRASRRLILVVDDEPSIRRALSQFLDRRGYAVCTASDVEEALKVLETRRVDAVVLDLVLPDPPQRSRTGMDVLAFMRERTGLAVVPVVLATGYPLTFEEEKQLESLHAEVFNKPYGFGQLAAHLDRETRRRLRLRAN